MKRAGILLRKARFLFFLLLLPLGFAHPPIGIVADKAGNVFYTDLGRVWRLEANGKLTVAVPDVHTHELFLDAEGNLFGEDSLYVGDQSGSGKYFHRLWKRSPGGSITDVVPKTEGFRGLYSFVRDRQGAMYLAVPADARVRRSIHRIHGKGSDLFAGGARLRKDGRGANAGFAAITWIAAGADGNIYALDQGWLRRIDPDGMVTTVVKGLDLHQDATEPHHLFGLQVDSTGNVYLADSSCRSVRKITPAGKDSVRVLSQPPWHPTGVYLSKDYLYILEWKEPASARVRKLPLHSFSVISRAPRSKVK